MENIRKGYVMVCDVIFKCVDGIVYRPAPLTMLVFFGIVFALVTFLIVVKEPEPSSPILFNIAVSFLVSVFITAIAYALVVSFTDYLARTVTVILTLVGVISSALAGRKVRNRNK